MKRKFTHSLSRVLLLLLMLCAGNTVVLADGTKHYLVFATDRHTTETAVSTAMSCWSSLPVEYVSLVGDMVGSGTSGPSVAPAYDVNTVWKEVSAVFPNLPVSQFSIVWANHDGGYTDSEGLGVMKCPDNETSTEIYTNAEHTYYIYAVNYYEMINAGTEAPEAFKAWVDGIDKSAAIIVLSHVPMHSKRGDNLNGANWCDALNYAATGSVNGSEITRNVVFFHGHNHTDDTTEYYYKPGTSVSMQGSSSSANKTIQYTYITAGYLKANGTATLLTLDDDEITFTKSKKGTTSVLGTVERVSQTPATYYEVTFESNGGSAVETQSVKENRTVTKPADPTRSGYVFVGWYSDEYLENPYDFSTPVTTPLMLYAKWTEDTSVYYTVTFNSNGADEVESQSVREGDTATKPADPTINGFAFEGWYSDETLTTLYDFTTPVTSDITLYAKWTEKEATEALLFTYASSATSGENYLLVSNGYALINNNGTLGEVAVTASGDNVTVENVDKSTLLWTVGSDGSLKNGSYYVRRASGSAEMALTLNTSTSSKYTNWVYTGEQVYVLGGSSNNTPYYIYYNSGWKTNSSTSYTAKLYKKVEDVMQEKCTMPTLTYEKGNVMCTCETEGVTYVYSMALNNATGESTDGILTIKNLVSVTVSVKAVREGYEDSDVASLVIQPWQVGDVNLDGSITIADVTALVNIILGK